MHITTKALVLREVDYKESDKILTLFTQSQGKLTASSTPRNSRWVAASLTDQRL